MHKPNIIFVTFRTFIWFFFKKKSISSIRLGSNATEFPKY